MVDPDLGERLLNQAKDLWADHDVQWYSPRGLLCRITKIEFNANPSATVLNKIIDTFDRIVPLNPVFEIQLEDFWVKSNNILTAKASDTSPCPEFRQLVKQCEDELLRLRFKGSIVKQLLKPYVSLAQLPFGWNPENAPTKLNLPKVIPVNQVALVNIIDHKPHKDYTFNLRKN